MGQCVFRDMGFDFEKDSQKQQVLTDFIKEVRSLFLLNWPIIIEISSKISINFQFSKSQKCHDSRTKFKIKVEGIYYFSEWFLLFKFLEIIQNRKNNESIV